MNITRIHFRKFCEHDKMKAICSVSFDDVFVVHDIKIIEHEDRLFIAMPSRRMKQGNYADIVHPIDPRFREMLETAIISEYKEKLSELRENPPDEES